jgi:hypothetical protein
MSALCLYCQYFMLEYENDDITGWGERWAPEHRIEPFVDAEYVWGSVARKLWEKVWKVRAKNTKPKIYFDYLYAGM